MGPKLLKEIVDELNEVITGGVISKIDQPGDRDLILKIFFRGKTRKLIISTDPVFTRLHLTSKKYPNPKNPKRFCSFLRSRVLNASIKSVEQRPGERIVDFTLEKKGEAKVSSFILRAELTGKSGNIILLDSDNVVLDALRYFQPHLSARAVTPGVALEELTPKKTKGREQLPEKPEGATWNGFIDAYYSGIIENGEFEAGIKRLMKEIKKAEKKTGRKLKNLYADKKKSEENLGASRFGQLLVTNLAAAKRGMKEAVLTDYTIIPPEEVRVPLEEKLTPAENAERFFRRSKKARTALKLLKERIPSVEGELEYINSLMYELKSAASVEDLAALGEELIKGGYMKKALPTAIKGKKPVKAEPVSRHTSGDGFLILIGRNATGNDIVVKKYTGAGDIWLHAQGVPGSHVLIKAGGKNKLPTVAAIAEAAALAAFFSKAGDSKKAEVIFTDAKNVKKPKGAKPGMVAVAEYKTILVEPKNILKDKKPFKDG